LLVRFKLAADSHSATHAWLTEQLLPTLPSRPGLAGVHLLKGALDAAMTAEQRIRGADSRVDWALLASGYELSAVAALEHSELAPAALQARGISTVSSALYASAYSLSADELAH
jgi:hypothetical protein